MTQYIWIDWTEYDKYLKRKGLILSSSNCTKCAPGRCVVHYSWRPEQARVSLHRIISFQVSQNIRGCRAALLSAGPAAAMLQPHYQLSAFPFQVGATLENVRE
jgi:hypothetical protein